MDFVSDPGKNQSEGFVCAWAPWWYRRRMQALCFALKMIWPEIKLGRKKGLIVDRYMSYGPDRANDVIIEFINSYGNDERLPATVAAVYRSYLAKPEGSEGLRE